MLVFTILFALGSIRDGRGVAIALRLALLPILVALPIVLVASLAIGLPLTRYLERTGRESLNAYAGAGVAAGFAIPVVMLLLARAPAGCWIGLLGAFGGAMTGRAWWLTARRPRLRPQP